MKIYIVTKISFPYGMAATSRIKSLVSILVQEKIECEIDIFTRTEVYGKEPKNTRGEGYYHGIRFKYMGGTPVRGKYRGLRKINDEIDKWRLLCYLKNNLKQGDIVLMYIGTDVRFTLKLIKQVHKCGAYCTRDLCELPYGTGKETVETIRKRTVVLQKQFPLLDGCLPISETLADLAQINCNEHCVIDKIPILVDYNQYKLDDRSEEAEVPYIFHSGTLYEQKDGILGMIEAFGMALQHTDKIFHFISTGNVNQSPHAKEIYRLIAKYKLEGKLFFIGYLSNNELKEYLAKASLVIINKYKTQQNHYCFSTKLGEYLAAAKPVIITRIGEAMNYLVDHESAYIIEPEDNVMLAKSIVSAFEHPEERKIVGKKGQEICRQYFDYRIYGNLLKNHFNSIIQKKSL